jgi:hypothetical protein
MATDPRAIVIAEMRKQTALLERIAAALSGHSASQTQTVNIDGPHGDPVVKAKDPRDWSGDPITGRTFSACPPDYLDLLAERYDYFASKEEDATKKRYNVLDAARARGWAARLRGGWTPPAQSARVDETQTEPAW